MPATTLFKHHRIIMLIKLNCKDNVRLNLPVARSHVSAHGARKSAYLPSSSEANFRRLEQERLGRIGFPGRGRALAFGRDVRTTHMVRHGLASAPTYDTYMQPCLLHKLLKLTKPASHRACENRCPSQRACRSV